VTVRPNLCIMVAVLLIQAAEMPSGRATEQEYSTWGLPRRYPLWEATRRHCPGWPPGRPGPVGRRQAGTWTPSSGHP